MGAWGGWALAPNTASMGRDLPLPHIYWSRGVAERSNGLPFFLTFWPVRFWQVLSDEKLLNGGPIGFASSRLVGSRLVGSHGGRRLVGSPGGSRLVGSHGGSWLVQVPGQGNLLMARGFFSGMAVGNRRDRHRRRGDDGRDPGKRTGSARAPP